MPTHRPRITEFSTADLAYLAKRKPGSIRRQLEEAHLSPSRVDGRTLWWDARDVFRVLTARGPDATGERARLDRARAESQEMKNAIMRGELLHGAEVARVGTEILCAVKSRVMALRTIGPAVRAVGSDAEAADLIEEGAREALTELAGLGNLVETAAGKVPDDGDDDDDPDKRRP